MSHGNMLMSRCVLFSHSFLALSSIFSSLSTSLQNYGRQGGSRTPVAAMIPQEFLLDMAACVSVG